MSVFNYNLTYLSNQQLLDSLARVNRQAHKVTAELLAHLAEVDARKLYLEQACSSLFSYCIERLGASEDETARRIHAARLARRFSVIFELVANGELFLSSINLLAPYLPQGIDPQSAHELIEQARGKTKRQVEQMLAARFPKPDVASTLRKLPVKAQAPLLVNIPATELESESSTPTLIKASIITSPANISNSVASQSVPVADIPPAVMPKSHSSLTPLSASRYKLQATLSSKGRNQLLRAKALLRHKLPHGELSDVIEIALERLCQQLEAKKFAKRQQAVDKQLVDKNALSTKNHEQHVPAHAASSANIKNRKPNSRYLPRPLRRQVAERDGYRCTFKTKDGMRCLETAGLEYHHVLPHAQGGRASIENIQLRCRQHNLHQAEIDFGAIKMRQAIE